MAKAVTVNNQKIENALCGHNAVKKGIIDAGSTADIRMLLSAMICYSLPWAPLVWQLLSWDAGCKEMQGLHPPASLFHPPAPTCAQLYLCLSVFCLQLFVLYFLFIYV